jgi:hypothetical protein
MDFDCFRTSLSGEAPPKELDEALQALWWDAKGNWDAAHSSVQAVDGPTAAWVHAYLHRKEGDLPNASYWYRKAGRPVISGSLDEEWASIADALFKPQAP